MTSEAVTEFNQLVLKPELLKSLDEIGYEKPTPIQALTIPLLLQGKDVLGQAQTGTGKTAAFALPLLSSLDLKRKPVQILVLAPTRELAIQVAEAFQQYSKYLKSFHVLPIYGGQDYSTQIRALKRGVHVVVGTPGRIMDHMRRGTLKLDQIKTLVLDEADEMLRMGFIDDVEWILEQIPQHRQIALFSATMPAQIRRIATTYLHNPEQITIKVKTTTAETIRQRYWLVDGMHKLDALTRVLEAEIFDALLIFVRTKTATVELAEKLQARGYAATALNGDIPQKQRERAIEQLKKSRLDILIATDVAARGLDVERVSHVINYDIPYDTEAYVHRIGRTGRAGRQGDAILFVSPREKRLLRAIEKATRKKIEVMEMPSTEMINDKRVAQFKQRITDTLAAENYGFYSGLVKQYHLEHNVPALDVAAALAKLVQGDRPLLLKNKPSKTNTGNKKATTSAKPGISNSKGLKRNLKSTAAGQNMYSYRIEVGREHEVKPSNIVGAIANEAGIDNHSIGSIRIQSQYSLVELPADLNAQQLTAIRNAWVAGRQLQISKLQEHKSSKFHKKTEEKGKRRKAKSDKTKKRVRKKSKK